MALRKKIIGGSVAALVVAGAVAGLQPSEGLSLTPYFDIVGVKTWCYGETQGTPKAKYTKAECLELLNTRVGKDYYQPLVKGIPGFEKLPVETQQATVELAYNIGTGATIKGSVGRLFTQGRIIEGCKAFMLYNKARVKGVLQPVRGLTLRRERETALCLKGAQGK